MTKNSPRVTCQADEQHERKLIASSSRDVRNQFQAQSRPSGADTEYFRRSSEVVNYLPRVSLRKKIVPGRNIGDAYHCPPTTCMRASPASRDAASPMVAQRTRSSLSPDPPVDPARTRTPTAVIV